MHLLLCNVSNQARSGREDAILRPWRPVPSGRITQSQTIALRWALVPICVALSAAYDEGLVAVTLYLSLTTYLYDEWDLAAHAVGKNVCNISGYTAFEIGATKIFGTSTLRCSCYLPELDLTQALSCPVRRDLTPRFDS